MANTIRFTVTLDVATLSREMSRDAFKAMPKQKRIGDKRRKQPRYKTNWRNEQ